LEEQQELLNEGATKTLDSAHLTGRAVDVYPYPVDFEDRDRWHYFGGYVLGTARQFGIDVIWGGDWDNDTKTKDNTFDDLMHFELK
jgi:peptidoglycan L-alanyl-D-glutamate endopeptidase CwlK